MNLEDVRNARARIAGRIHQTPLLSARRLGESAGVALTLKCESFQKTGSFKARGALNAIEQLSPADRAKGVITISAGNHAQALAWAASAAGVRATVVMPASAPALKVAASRGYGAEVIQHGSSTVEAFEFTRRLQKERGLTMVHPFDDPPVAAGAGTVALEILEQDSRPIDVLVVPIGGGGLISGIAVVMRAMSPKTRIIGVEPVGAAVMRKSLDAGRPERLDRVDTIADGLSAPMAGELTYPIVRDMVDDVVIVSDDDIRSAMRDLMQSAKLIAEPAGAAGIAALRTGKLTTRQGQSVCVVISGGNVDLSRIAEVATAS
jgi:threonine ammonia-lyase medium form